MVAQSSPSSRVRSEGHDSGLARSVDRAVDLIRTSTDDSHVKHIGHSSRQEGIRALKRNVWGEKIQLEYLSI